jgi:hypothetical protein
MTKPYARIARQIRPALEELYGSDYDEVEIDSLSSRTRRNLSQLEGEGWVFGPTARRIPLFQFQDEWPRIRAMEDVDSWQSRVRVAYTYLIEGTDNRGRPVVYVRREYPNKASGQTYIYTPKRRITLGETAGKRMNSLLQFLGASEEELGGEEEG